MKPRGWMWRLRQRWQLLVFVLPAFLYILIFDYRPMYGIVIAFQDFKLMKGIPGSAYVGLENFRRLFSSYWFPIILKNTLSISLLSLLLSFPLPILLALMVNEMKSPVLKKGFQTMSYAPHFISVVVVCAMTTLFLSPSSGVISRFFALFGGEPRALIQEPRAFKWIYVLSGMWQNTGWDAASPVTVWRSRPIACRRPAWPWARPSARRRHCRRGAARACGRCALRRSLRRCGKTEPLFRSDPGAGRSRAGCAIAPGRRIFHIIANGSKSRKRGPYPPFSTFFSFFWQDGAPTGFCGLERFSVLPEEPRGAMRGEIPENGSRRSVRRPERKALCAAGFVLRRCFGDVGKVWTISPVLGQNYHCDGRI